MKMKKWWQKSTNHWITFLSILKRDFLKWVNSRIFEGLVPLTDIKSNQIFHYTRCNTPKRVTSRRAHLCVIAPGQHSSFGRNTATVASSWQHCFDLTGPRFNYQTYRSRDDRVPARPTAHKNN